MALTQWIRQHRTVTALVVAVVFAAAVVLLVYLRRIDATRLSEPLKRGSIVVSVYGIGTVNAARSFDLKTAVPATVRRLHVKEGDRVERGQPLVQLDQNVFRAPFAGTVVSLPVMVGETVLAQAVVLELVDLQDRYMTVSLEQRAALRVRKGQRARISFESLRAEPEEGVVEAVYARDTNFLVRIDVSKLPPQVLPGMTADVAIVIEERENVLLVPVAAIEEGRVYVQRGAGRPEAVAVEVGAVDDTMAEVVNGDLREGDRVVLPEAPRA